MKGEVIFIQLYDVGRRIDLKNVTSVFPGTRDKRIIKTKDTPAEIYVPKPLVLEISHKVSIEPKFIRSIKLQSKLYEDGVISLIARLNFENISLRQLHALRYIKFKIPDGIYRVEKWLKIHFDKLYRQIEDFIDKYNYPYETPEREEYTLFCITDEFNNPHEFVKENKHYFASLLMGENPELKLHDNQIKDTLENQFSFLKNDLVIFDLDRCLIIDSSKDYEDILLISELANYQLLELRTLDRLLDKQLSIAEEDVRKVFFKRRSLLGSLNKKLGALFRLRFDVTFILENIENVSKIIGDYYLAQIFNHLGRLYELDRWSKSIRNRLKILDDLYSTAQTNVNEKILVYVEILLGVIFVMEFVFFLISYFL